MELFMDYIKGIGTSKRAYFKVLENNFPTWLNEYINTKEMLRLQYVSASCGKIHSKMFNMKIDYMVAFNSFQKQQIIGKYGLDGGRTQKVIDSSFMGYLDKYMPVKESSK